MGAKMFAWLGGLALLLGVAFFVKYSFEHNLIPPEVRVIIGFILGVGLIAGGLAVPRKRYAITAQTLCAAGVVSLYAVTFACNSVYKFPFFGTVPTFLLMALITAAGFLLAVRLEARVVAVLGFLAGFLTPILLSTGQDHPLELFGYLALLDLGLIAIALVRSWSFLIPLGAGGTILMQLGWAANYFAPAEAGTATAVCLGFCGLYLLGREVASRMGRSGPGITASAVAFPFVAFGFAVLFLFHPALAARPGQLFSLVFLADAVLLVLCWRDKSVPHLHAVAGFCVFALLGAWTAGSLTDALLPWALALYLIQAALHTSFPVFLRRRDPGPTQPWWSQVFPPLTLALMLIPLFKLEEVSALYWPCVLIIDLIAMAVALITASIVPVAVTFLITLAATAFWLFQIAPDSTALPGSLAVIGGFAVLFFAAGIFLSRKLGQRLRLWGDFPAARGVFGDKTTQIPAFSSLLPFLLLMMLAARLRLMDPSPIFGLALLLALLALGLAAIMSVEWLPACALVGVGALEYVWRATGAGPRPAGILLAWSLGFTALFETYPFLFRRRFSGVSGPWAVAALAGVVQFPLVYRLVITTWPTGFPGLLPALFAIPALLSLWGVSRMIDEGNPRKLSQLAWFGGVSLFFITLIFPIQFERQWITVGWAFEGAALLWLFHRIPHPGLRMTGAALLVAAFARLALNPAVLEYHSRGESPLLNWYWYGYGSVAISLFAGAQLLGPPRDRILGLRVPPLLQALAVVALFLLLNIEITDFFATPGSFTPLFEFSGNFARDMTYTIAWALFALGLLLVGLRKKAKAGRYAAIGLLSATLVKLFFHDLSELGSLYRVGAFFAVAAIAIMASFAYQRFLPGTTRSGRG